MALAPVTELAIALPFKIDALGKVAATVDQAKIWADRARSVIGTALGQRVYRPNFGCNATLGVYDSEEYVLETIKDDINVAFQSFLPLLTILEIQTEISPETRILTVDVSYSTPGGVDYQVRLGIATVEANGTVSEEFKWLN